MGLPLAYLYAVCLVVTLKQSVRRCLYRRWEGKVVGREVRTKIFELERIYRGNTPYPIGEIRITAKSYTGRARPRGQAVTKSPDI